MTWRWPPASPSPRPCPHEPASQDRGQGGAGGAARLVGSHGRDAITKTFNFQDFNAAFGWMSRIALAAAQLDHHPEWFNVYSRVEVLLATHDADGVTELDVKLAKLMDQAAKDSGAKP